MLIEHSSQFPKVQGFDLEELCTNQLMQFHHMTI